VSHRTNSLSASRTTITKAIVLAHGGALSLHDREPHGLTVRIRLPARQPNARPAA